MKICEPLPDNQSVRCREGDTVMDDAVTNEDAEDQNRESGISSRILLECEPSLTSIDRAGITDRARVKRESFHRKCRY